MHIVFLSDYFYPEVTAAANRTYEHCRYWVEAGADVTVITSIPNFPIGVPFEGYEGVSSITECIEGINVVRVQTYMARNEKVIKRSIDYASYSVSSFLKGLQIKPDIIVATSPHLLIPGSGFLLSRLWKVPFILEIRDLWPESIAAVGALSKGFIYKMLEKYEMFLYRKADAIICNTNGLISNITERGIDRNKMFWIPNGVDNKSFGTINEVDVTDWKQKLKLDNKFVVSYIGTVGMAHGLDFIVKAFEKINQSDIHLLIVGDGAEKMTIKNIAQKGNKNNITFLPQVSKNDVQSLYELTDVALVNLKKNDSFKKHLPSKIFDVGYFGKPMLLGIDGEAKHLIEKYNAGIYFEPEREESFIYALMKLYKSDVLRTELSNGCRKLAKDFNRKELALEMLEIIKTAKDS